jgi:hypothetical protein
LQAASAHGSRGICRAGISGGRQFADAGFLWQTLDDLSAATHICEVVRGATGAIQITGFTLRTLLGTTFGGRVSLVYALT